MTEQPQGWRVVVIANVLPIVEPLIETVRGMGHDVVAWVMQRRPESRDLPPPPWGETGDKTAPQGTNLIWVRDKADLAPLLRGLEPDVVLCWGFSWKIPQEALDVPRYGAVNQHPALLPRHRGPIPLSWALREGDDVFGTTWHRMDADFDTGAILAQSSIPILDEETTMFETGPRIVPAGLALLPQVFERLAAGDPGDPQGTEGASWGGMFERGLRDDRLVGADGSGDPQPGAGVDVHVRHGPGAGAVRRARRQAREGDAHAAHRPGRRLAGRRDRRRDDLDPRVRAVRDRSTGVRLDAAMEEDTEIIAGQLAELTRTVESMAAQLKALGERADSERERADEQQERSEVQQERIDLAARELAEVSDRLQAAANALRESI